MAGVETLEHIDGLSASDFPYNNPGRTHSQRRPDQITDGDGLPALHVGALCLEADEIADSLNLQLGIVLDGDDPL